MLVHPSESPNPDPYGRRDPTKVEAGRLGGLSRARRRLAHLSDVEVEVLYDLEQQARAYRDGTNGSPSGVAPWLRRLADKLEGKT